MVVVVIVLCCGADFLSEWILCSKGSKWNNEEGGLSPNSSGKPKIISRRLGLGCSCMLQQENDPKHTSKVVKKWLNQARVEVFWT